MIEIFVITLFCLILFYPTLKYSIIVDDIRLYKNVQDGWLKSNPNIFAKIKKRLYGGATFASNRACPLCKGSKKVLGNRINQNGSTAPKSEEIDCPQCNATGLVQMSKPEIEHAFTSFLHTTICILIYLALGNNYISFVAALLYACNPSNHSTSIWLNGRRYQIVIILTLLMLLVPRPLALGFYLLMPAFQVTGLFAPILLGGLYWLAIPVFLLIGRKQFVNFFNERIKSLTSPEMKNFHPGKLIVFVKQFGFYILKMIFPGRTFLVYRFLSYWGLTQKGNDDAYSFSLDYHFYIGACALCGIVPLLFTLKGDILLCLIFAVLATAQWSNLITATQVCADRYISLANVFVMYLVAYTANHFLYNQQLFDAFIIGLLAYYTSNHFVNMKMFKNIDSFYDYHDFYFPDNVNPRKWRVEWKLRSNPRDIIGAWQLIKEGLKHNPEDFTFLFQGAICSRLMGDYKASNDFLLKAEMNYYLNQEELWKPQIQDLREDNIKNMPSGDNGKHRFKPQGDMLNFARAKK